MGMDERNWVFGEKMQKGPCNWIFAAAERLIVVLWGAGVYEVPGESLLPTCYPFVIPIR